MNLLSFDRTNPRIILQISTNADGVILYLGCINNKKANIKEIYYLNVKKLAI